VIVLKSLAVGLSLGLSQVIAAGSQVVAAGSQVAVAGAIAQANEPMVVKNGLQQIAQNIIPITGVELTSTDAGLEINFQTGTGLLNQGTSSERDKTLLIEIPNAQLQLSDQSTFRRDDPAVGIQSIVIRNSSPTTVQVEIVGRDRVPERDVIPGKTGLTISLSIESEAEEEIVVTAQKAPERPQDVPISLTVLPRQVLEDTQINSLPSIAANVPNFSLFRFGGNRSLTTYSIRGLGNANFQSRDSVGFYIDDVPFDGARTLDIDVADLERVEVLRGPQSTLYGKNAQAGVVNIITRPPSNKPEIRIAGSYGSENFRDVQLSLSDAIIPDKLAFRLAGAYSGRDGFTRNTLLNTEVGATSNLNGRAQILWTPAKEWNVSFNAFTSYNDEDGAIFTPLSNSDPFKIQQDFDGYSRLSTNTQALKIAYTGAQFQAAAITARRFSNTDAGQDADASPDNLFNVFQRLNTTTWTQEVRFQSPSNSDRFKWLLGGYFESQQTNVNNYGFAFGPSFGGAFDGTFADLTQTTFATFGQVEYKPIAPLTLIAGLRYESSRTQMDRFRQLTPAGETPQPTGTAFNDVEQTNDIVIPRFGLEYQVSPNVIAYGTVSRGYKPGGLNFFADSESELKFQPETSWNYEAGLKSSWLNDRLGVNFSIFRTTSDSFQVSVADFSNFTSIVTNAEVAINGGELELRATPVKGLDITAGLGYVDGKFERYTNPFSGQSFNGNQLTFSPSVTYNLALQYRHVNGVFGRLELRGYGNTFFNEANTLEQDPFALLNARIGYEGRNYGIYLFANNLLNAEYLTYAFSGATGAIGSYGDRRLYGIQVRANF
jgi:iron complex outermembrane recepter protein